MQLTLNGQYRVEILKLFVYSATQWLNTKLFTRYLTNLTSICVRTREMCQYICIISIISRQLRCSVEIRLVPL